MTNKPTYKARFEPYGKSSSTPKPKPSPRPDASPSPTPSKNALVTDAIFAPNSFWYKPIPKNVRLHPKSPNYVRDFLRQKEAYYKNVTVNTKSYTSPVFIANSSARDVKMRFHDCQKKGWLDGTYDRMMSAVPIPPNAKPSAGTDREMTVYEPSTKTLWEVWQSRKDSSGRWYACWGGKLENASTNQGIFQKGYGAAATGLPFIGGQITAEELKRGEIKHVIGIALVEMEHPGIYSWPANRSDGYNPKKKPNRIVQGQRFRLDPNVNVDALPMSRAGKIIAKAAQKYGFVVWDKAGSISIRAQNAVSYTALGKPDPYPALFEYKGNSSVLDGFPWEKLQFLPMNYGRP